MTIHDDITLNLELSIESQEEISRKRVDCRANKKQHYSGCCSFLTTYDQINIISGWCCNGIAACISESSMVCRLIRNCLFISIIVHCSGQTDLVGRCETCREVVKNFQKASSLI